MLYCLFFSVILNAVLFAADASATLRARGTATAAPVWRTLPRREVRGTRACCWAGRLVSSNAQILELFIIHNKKFFFPIKI